MTVKKSPVKKSTPAKNVHNNRKKLTPEQVDAANKKQQKPNLKPSQIAEMEALWESGEYTLKDLGERFNRNPSAISRHMSINNVEQGSKAEEYRKAINERVFQDLYGDIGENAQRIKKTREQHLSLNNTLRLLTIKQFNDAKEKNLPLQSKLPNLKAIREGQAIFAALRDEDWKLLRAEEFEKKFVEDEVPILHISELTGMEIDKMQADQMAAGLDDSFEKDFLDDVIEEGLVD